MSCPRTSTTQELCDYVVTDYARLQGECPSYSENSNDKKNLLVKGNSYDGEVVQDHLLQSHNPTNLTFLSIKIIVVNSLFVVS